MKVNNIANLTPMTKVLWVIHFYSAKVMKDLESLPAGIQADFIDLLDQVGIYGPLSASPIQSLWERDCSKSGHMGRKVEVAASSVRSKITGSLSCISFKRKRRRHPKKILNSVTND